MRIEHFREARIVSPDDVFTEDVNEKDLPSEAVQLFEFDLMSHYMASGSTYNPHTKTVKLMLFVPYGSVEEDGVFSYRLQPRAGSLMDIGLTFFDERGAVPCVRPYSIAASWAAKMKHITGIRTGRVYLFFIRLVEGGEFSNLLLRMIDMQPSRASYRDIEDLYGENGYIYAYAIYNNFIRHKMKVSVSRPYRMFPVDENLTHDIKSATDSRLKVHVISSRAFYGSGTGIAPFLLHLQNCHLYTQSLKYQQATGEDKDPYNVHHITATMKTRDELQPTDYGYLLLQWWYKVVKDIQAAGLEPPRLNLLFTRELQEAAIDIRKNIHDLMMHQAPAILDHLTIYGQDREVLEGLQEKPDKIYAQDILRGYLNKDIDKDFKVYAAGYGDMLRALGSVNQREFERPHYLFAYEAFTG